MRRYVWILGIIIGILTGCSSAHVHTDQVKGVNFSAYKTYSWAGDEVHQDKNAPLSISKITMENMRRTTDEEMQRRGFVHNPSNPDLVLKLRTSMDEREDVAYYTYPYSSGFYPYYYSPFGYGYYGYNYPGSWYPNYYGSYYGPIRYNYVEGTIKLDMIEKRTNRTIWSGTADEVIDDSKDADEMYENVKEIFDDFPVKDRG